MAQSFFFGTLYIAGGVLCLTAAAFLLTVMVTIGKVICETVRKKDFSGFFKGFTKNYFAQKKSKKDK